MDIGNAQRLIESLPTDAKVVDVGGGAAPFPRADYVIDFVGFDQSGAGSDGNVHQRLNIAPRYSRERWIQVDLCDRKPWPVADGAFDFAVCSHLLEDVRDPIWLCSELQRVAKAGYIEVPSRVVEQSKGVENPRHAGFWHHRWLIERKENRLEFRIKPHMLHSVNDAIVKHLSPNERINSEHAIVTLDWVNSFEAIEVLEFDECEVVKELCRFAARTRKLPQLTEERAAPTLQQLKRQFYYMRLRLGRGWET